MKIQNQPKTRKILIIVIAAAIVLFGGATVYAYTTNSFPFNSSETDTPAEENLKENDVNLDTPTDEQKDAGLDAKKDFIDKNYNEDESGGGSTDAAAISITSIGGNTNKTSVRAMVNASSASGTCTVTATGQGSPVEATAGLQQQGSYSICMGFDLALSKGRWNISVVYTDTNGAISKDTQEYEVR